MVPVGYSIFVVVGCLPSCEADELLTLIPVEPEKESLAHPQSSGREWKRPRGPKQSKRDRRQEGEDEGFSVQLATAASKSTVESKQRSRDYKREEDFAVRLATAISESSKESGPYFRDYDQEEEDMAVQLATAMSESYSLALQKKEREEVTSCEGGTLSDEESDATLVGSSEEGDAESNDVALATAISASLDGVCMCVCVCVYMCVCVCACVFVCVCIWYMCMWMWFSVYKKYKLHRFSSKAPIAIPTYFLRNRKLEYVYAKPQDPPRLPHLPTEAMVCSWHADEVREILSSSGVPLP